MKNIKQIVKTNAFILSALVLPNRMKLIEEPSDIVKQIAAAQTTFLAPGTELLV